MTSRAYKTVQVLHHQIQVLNHDSGWQSSGTRPSEQVELAPTVQLLIFGKDFIERCCCQKCLSPFSNMLLVDVMAGTLPNMSVQHSGINNNAHIAHYGFLNRQIDDHY